MKSTITLFFAFIFSTLLISAQAKEESKIKTIKIKTTAQCEECKDRIEKAMAYEKGVKTSNLDLETKVLTVVYNGNKTTDAKIRKAISNTGYDADDIKKNQKAYNALPACCKLPTDPQHKGH